MTTIPPGTDLNTIPAGVPPDGVKPEIGGGAYLGTTSTVLESVMMSLAIITVSCRLAASWHTRKRQHGGFSLADWSSIGALIFSIAQSGIVITLHNFMRHQYNMSLGMMTESYFKRTFAQYIIAWPAIFLAKFSILWLYLRLFGVKRMIRFGVPAGIIWAALAYLPNIAIAAYYCAARPGEPWGFAVGMRCGDKNSLKWLVCSAAMSVLLDIYIFVLPIPVVVKLKMSGKRRVGVFFIFSTAFFAIICAALTLVYRVKVLLSTDPMWLSAQLFICNAVENYIAIIVGALPGCSSLFKSHIQTSRLFISMSSGFGSLRSSSNKSSLKSSHHGKDSTRDSESQRSLNYSAGQIGVKRSYEVSQTVV